MRISYDWCRSLPQTFAYSSRYVDGVCLRLSYLVGGENISMELMPPSLYDSFRCSLGVCVGFMFDLDGGGEGRWVKVVRANSSGCTKSEKVDRLREEGSVVD